jgi:hypothetical protein
MQCTDRLAILGFLAAVLVTGAHAQVTLKARVVDEDGAPLANARISAQLAPMMPFTVETGPTGTFTLDLPVPGTYLVTVQRTGFFQLTDRPVEVDGTGREVTLVLNPNREVFQSVNVGESSSPFDPAQTERVQRLSGTEVNDIPYPATQSFKNSLRLIPGVIQDPAAGVHFHGGAEYQTQYILDGFDITDPITGHFDTTLAVEGIRAVDVISSRESAQYGRGSAGTMAVHVENGTDQFHFTATNFIPGFDTRNGFGLGDWSPRAGFSGPLAKGRAWFSDSITGGYNSGVVTGLPRGQNTNSSWAAGNLFHSQVNLTQSNILFGDFLSNFTSQAHSGLGPLDPIPTTSSRHSNEFLGSLKDSQAWRSGAYIEVGLAFERVFHQSTPQGSEPYVISPSGRSGNYFVNSREHGGRKQVFANFFPPVLHWAGRHQLQTGADFQRLDYTAGFSRTGFEIVGLNGLPEYSTTFGPPSRFHLPNSTAATYVQDHWTPIKPLVIDVGLRQDWDQLTGCNVVAPRIAAAWSPFENSRTKLLAGYSVIYDATNLATFARPYDQQPTTTPYSPDGVPGTPYTTTFLPGHNLRLPRYQQLSAGIEHDFGHGIYATADWLRKRGSDGFVYTPVNGTQPISEQQYFPGAESGGVYVLSNLRRDRYDEYAVTIRQSLPNQYEWLASYVHSSAVSNAVLDISIDQTLQVSNNFGPMPWDVPNRILSEGYLPAHFKDWAIAYLADWRTGFPFTIVSPANQVIGAVDSQRYGSNFDLNLHVERRLVLFRYRLAIRVGANNLTDHRNATAVNNVVGAPNFMHFYGYEGRHLVVRIRMFGRVK